MLIFLAFTDEIWLCAHVISYVKNFKASILKKRRECLVAETIIVIRCRVVLVRPRNQMECQASLLRNSGDRIECLPRPGGVLEDSVAESDIIATGGCLWAVINVADNGFVSLSQRSDLNRAPSTQEGRRSEKICLSPVSYRMRPTQSLQ